MYWALIKKELREVLPTVAVAAVAYVLAISMATQNWIIGKTPLGDLVGRGTPSVVFASDDFRQYFLLVSLAFVTILGFQQSLMEEWRGTYRLLLHRPISRREVFAIKVITGLGIYFIAGGGALLYLSLWAATPGRQPAPFFWFMTVPTLLVLLTAPIVYLGAFLSAIRPSRWYGTKLFPWGVSLIAFLLMLEMASYGPVFLLVSVPLLVTNIVWVIQQREFA